MLDKVVINLEIIIDLPIGFPINNIISLSSTREDGAGKACTLNTGSHELTFEEPVVCSSATASGDTEARPRCTIPASLSSSLISTPYFLERSSYESLVVVCRS